jgi:hypothetical protein
VCALGKIGSLFLANAAIFFFKLYWHHLNLQQEFRPLVT